jgi:hypothetical protein
MGAFLKKIILGLLVILVAYLSFIYFATYSEGDRAGKIVKISQTGVIFKTWEGQLDLGTFGAVKSSNFASETFEFSIDGDNKILIEKLRKAQLTGERVLLKYEEKYAKIPWKGSTKYIVVDVMVNKESKEDKKELPVGAMK